MPEGHTLYRIASRHNELLAGSYVRASSPQGRFSEDAALIDGRRLDAVDAYGKHLFYRFDAAPVLHVHLGLVGKFPTFSEDRPAPSPATRLVLESDRAVAYLIGPMTCRLIDTAEGEIVIAELGPDPLRGRRGRVAFLGGLERRTKPIGEALLDQGLIAGIGNVFRSELLFLAGVHPLLPANRLDGDNASRLWDLAVDEMRNGVRFGHIVTVRPRDVGARSRADLDRDERLYVYHREGLPCRRCGTAIAVLTMGSRRMWWCPVCQPGGIPASALAPRS